MNKNYKICNLTENAYLHIIIQRFIFSIHKNPVVRLLIKITEFNPKKIILKVHRSFIWILSYFT